tara:strand:+ start:3587 stop:3850 length:264 start_codon:yes stop_codon:yes gene_type:complete
MSTATELNSVFNQAEELVGTYPSSDGLRNAIYAVITQGFDDERFNHQVTPLLRNNVEYFASNYEASRGTHMHMGTGCLLFACDTPSD